MLVELGNELQQARAAKHISLEAVAGPARISAAYLHKLERGAVDSPSPRVLARIAGVLETSYLKLMERAGYLDDAQLAQTRLLESEPRPHPLAGQQLTPEEWTAVGAFIKLLIAQRADESAKPG